MRSMRLANPWIRVVHSERSERPCLPLRQIIDFLYLYMANKKEKLKNVKNNGRIYTPSFIVENILDLAGYQGNILEKHIIDNSCGDGAFLIEVVKRYCTSFTKKHDTKKPKELTLQLEQYIHGIEIEETELNKCQKNLTNEAKKFGAKNVKWDLVCADTLTVSRFNGQMDYVVGNPPYVRVHNLAESYNEVKKFKFSQGGMTDLYIVFFEIGLAMLNGSGKMGMITPSSCLKSKAGNNFRKYVSKNKNLTKVVDLEHFQPFNATTYTMITLFEMGKKINSLEYYVYDEIKKKPQKIETLNYSDMFVNGNIFVSKKENLKLLHQIENYNQDSIGRILVKNGFATLADNFFIGNFEFGSFTIDILKASKGKWYKCIFPYNKAGQPLSIHDIQKKSDVYKYLLENKDLLKSRSLNNSEWYLFGRTQAIKDVFRDKIAINTIIKDENSIKIESVPAGSGVYSGLYILSDYSVGEIKKAIKNQDFIKYIKLLKNYKSGGYFTFSSAELQKFLTYTLRKNNHEQQTIFAVSR